MKPPEKLGPFLIRRLVGRGGMGAVYEAVHEELNEVVALKVLMANVEEDQESRNRFESEIETLKRLRHPNIVRIYGFGEDADFLYYAMEFVDGPSLGYLQKNGHHFSWEEVVHIGAEVCKALRHAHDRGIVHRDIKPANILMPPGGDVKVSDYGIAHFFGGSRLTGGNVVVGTIEYMAPEQAQAGPLSPRTDLYSLGATLYALLTKVPPYRAKTLQEILQKYKSGPPESIRFLRPEVPTVLDLFILELLRVDPEQRPSDARMVGRRLEAIRMAFTKTPDKPLFHDTLYGPSNSFGPGGMFNRNLVESPNSNVGDVVYFDVAAVKNEDASFDLADDPEIFVSSASPEQHTHTEAETKWTGSLVLQVEDEKKDLFDPPSFAALALPPTKEHLFPAPLKKSGGLVIHGASQVQAKSPGGISRLFDVGATSDVAGSGTPQATASLGANSNISNPEHPHLRSHFTIVVDNEEEAFQAAGLSRWYISAKIWLFLIISCSVAFFFWYTLRPPNADHLFGLIETKIKSDDKDYYSTLRQAEKEMRSFVSIYPNDLRAERVIVWISELELTQLERRLERQIERKSKDGGISPVENAYIEAIQLTKTDPEEGIIKLAAFVNLFSVSDKAPLPDSLENELENHSLPTDQFASTAPDKSSEKKILFERTIQGQCVLLAQRRLEKVRREFEAKTKAESVLLEGRLEYAQAIERIDPQRAAAIRMGIATFYEGQQWAKPIIENANRELNKQTEQDPGD